ncbi:carbohydrate ABC transporter permease [Cohnella sp. LGH]|uniref:carbohydrate ABC transporter permease n=1 Tax=unclassified Cohnella TaxID=2636738 RepID=UPI001AD9626C|nr:carbohydrate ABC transporter permease [Cohnella sp. LGH]QTH42817.1 carbohydrate ABC transporter permease [Cohnella sp. LGH]
MIKQHPMSRVVLFALLTVLLLVTLLPFLVMLFLSTKDHLDILIDFWAIPEQIKWANFSNAYDTVIRSIGNSLYVCFVTVLGVLILGSLAGFVFARHQFPFKNTLFFMLLIILMIPGLLMVVPLYSLVSSLNLTQSYWGLILPYLAGAQLLGILVCRSFFESIPEELFEAARMDGGSEFFLYRKIALPLSVSVLITIGIVTFLNVYNDYLWPLIVLESTQRTFAVAVVNLSSSGQKDLGLTFGAYILGSIPTFILLVFGMKYYVQGMLSGAVKS